MEPKKYWIRNEGRVHGPYDAQTIKGLAASGTLRKDMEMSVDKERWLLADSVKGLFASLPKLADSQRGPGFRNEQRPVTPGLSAASDTSRPSMQNDERPISSAQAAPPSTPLAANSVSQPLQNETAASQPKSRNQKLAALGLATAIAVTFISIALHVFRRVPPPISVATAPVVADDNRPSTSSATRRTRNGLSDPEPTGRSTKPEQTSATVATEVKKVETPNSAPPSVGYIKPPDDFLISSLLFRPGIEDVSGFIPAIFEAMIHFKTMNNGTHARVLGWTREENVYTLHTMWVGEIDFQIVHILGGKSQGKVSIVQSIRGKLPSGEVGEMPVFQFMMVNFSRDVLAEDIQQWQRDHPGEPLH